MQYVLFRCFSCLLEFAILVLVFDRFCLTGLFAISGYSGKLQGVFLEVLSCVFQIVFDHFSGRIFVNRLWEFHLKRL